MVPSSADAGTDDDVAANFLHGSRSVEVELETPLPPLLDLSRAINPVENVDQVLTFEFGKYLARRNTQSHHGKRGSHRSICGHITVLGTCERDDEGREAVERTPDDVGFAYRIVQAPGRPHGFQGNPIGIFGCALLPVHAGDQTNARGFDRAHDPHAGHDSAGRAFGST